MNRFQMDGRKMPKQWEHKAECSKGKVQTSIHPFPRRKKKAKADDVRD